MEEETSSAGSYVVLDASLALTIAVVGEPHREQARRFLADCLKNRTHFISPPLFESESDSVLRLREYTGKMTAEQVTSAQTTMDMLPVEIVQEAAVRNRARQIAKNTNQVRVYDATYAALAELRGCDMWTADERFYNSVKANLSYVRFIGSY